MKNKDEFIKHQEKLKEQSTRGEEKRIEQEQKEIADKNTERLRKEEERRRKEQNDRREHLEHLKQVEEHRKQRERELADIQVGGENRNLEKHLARGNQLDIQANKKGKGVKQEKKYKSIEEKQIDLESHLEIVQKYEQLKNNVQQLDKINRNLENLQDKKLKEKYQTSKESLEKKICSTLNIKKVKRRFFQSKKAVEKSFNDKVQKELVELGTKVELSRGKLKELKLEEKQRFTHDKNKINSNKREIQTQTRSRGR